MNYERIQFKDYTSKKTGVTTRKFYAPVWDASQEKLVTGPSRNIEDPKPLELNRIPKAVEKQLRLDEAAIIEAISSGNMQKRKAGPIQQGFPETGAGP